MRFNTAPANTLFVKVSVKLQPYSQNPVSVRVVADMFQNFTANKAQFYTELPLQNLTVQQLQDTIVTLQTRANAARVQVKVQPKVSKLLQSVA